MLVMLCANTARAQCEYAWIKILADPDQATGAMGAGDPPGQGTILFRKFVAHDDGTPGLFAVGDISYKLGNQSLSVGVHHGVMKWNSIEWATLIGSSGRYIVNGTAGAVHNSGSGNKLYVAGTIYTGSGNVTGIAEWDGSDWTVIVNNTDGAIYAMTSYLDDLYFAGTLVDSGNSRVYIGRWTSGTTFQKDHYPSGEGTTIIVYDLVGFAMGGTNRLWSAVSGDVGNTKTRVYRLDIGMSRTFNEEVISNSYHADTNALIIDTTGSPSSLVAGGGSVDDGCVYRRGASTWAQAANNELNSGHVFAFAIYDDTGGAKLYAAGEKLFVESGPDAGAGLARINGSGDWEVFPGQPAQSIADIDNSRVDTLCTFADNCGDAYIMAGGDFQEIYNADTFLSLPSNRIAGFGRNKADFDCDGFPDFLDYDAYVACFEDEDCPEGVTADFNCDGFVDFFDFDSFVFWWDPPD